MTERERSFGELHGMLRCVFAFVVVAATVTMAAEYIDGWFGQWLVMSVAGTLHAAIWRWDRESRLAGGEGSEG